MIEVVRNINDTSGQGMFSRAGRIFKN